MGRRHVNLRESDSTSDIVTSSGKCLIANRTEKKTINLTVYFLKSSGGLSLFLLHSETLI